MTNVACPHCGSQLINDGILGGRAIVCSSCGGHFQMPMVKRRREPTLWDAIFDFAFAFFITPRIVKAYWRSCVLLAGAGLILLAGFNIFAIIMFLRDDNRPISILLILFMSDLLVPLMIWMWLMTVRLVLETIMILFRSEEHLRLLANQARIVAPSSPIIAPPKRAQ